MASLFREITMEGDFKALLRDMRPNAVLFQLIKTMLDNVWNQRTKQISEIRKAFRRDILKLNRQIDGYLDKIVDASSNRVVQAFDRKIDQLENEKINLSKKLEKAFSQKTPQQKCSNYPCGSSQTSVKYGKMEHSPAKTGAEIVVFCPTPIPP